MNDVGLVGVVSPAPTPSLLLSSSLSGRPSPLALCGLRFGLTNPSAQPRHARALALITARVPHSQRRIDRRGSGHRHPPPVAPDTCPRDHAPRDPAATDLGGAPETMGCAMPARREAANSFGYCAETILKATPARREAAKPGHATSATTRQHQTNPTRLSATPRPPDHTDQTHTPLGYGQGPTRTHRTKPTRPSVSARDNPSTPTLPAPALPGRDQSSGIAPTKMRSPGSVGAQRPPERGDPSPLAPEPQRPATQP